MTLPEKGGVLDRKLHEHINYPKHPTRKATKLYEKSHKRLVHTLDLPCFICGVRQSTLKDPIKNKWGAISMQTHHKIIEDSLINAVDLDKFNSILLHYLAWRYPRQVMYKTPFTQEQMTEWAHGNEANLQVLCSVHHNHELTGIHNMSHPAWIIQNLIFEDYDLTGFKAASAREAKDFNSLPTTTGEAGVLDNSTN